MYIRKVWSLEVTETPPFSGVGSPWVARDSGTLYLLTFQMEDLP